MDAETLFAVGEDVGGRSVGGQGKADTSDPLGIVAVDALVPKDQLEGTCGVVYHGEGERTIYLQLAVERTGGLKRTVGQGDMVAPQMVVGGGDSLWQAHPAHRIFAEGSPARALLGLGGLILEKFGKRWKVVDSRLGKRVGRKGQQEKRKNQP